MTVGVGKFVRISKLSGWVETRGKTMTSNSATKVLGRVG